MKWLPAIPVLPLLAAGLMVWPTLWILSCSPKDEALAIRALIEKAAKLAEAHEIGDLMDLTTDDFIASPGRHDIRETRSILFLAFRHYGQFSIIFPRPSLDWKEQSDEAAVVVYFTIVRDGQPLPGLNELYDDPKNWVQKAGDKVDLYQLKLQVKKVKKKWLVESAHLVGFKGLGF